MNEQELEQNKIINDLGDYPLCNYKVTFSTSNCNFLPHPFNEVQFCDKLKNLLSNNNTQLDKIYFDYDNFDKINTSNWAEWPVSFSRYVTVSLILVTTEFLIERSAIKLIIEFFMKETGEFLQLRSINREWRVIMSDSI